MTTQGRSAVVIGAGVGGLSAAIHARLRGWDVLVLEAREAAGGKACEMRIGGYRLDPGPSIIILRRVYEQLFREASRTMGDYLRFRELSPISRVFMEGRAQPVDIPSGREEAIRALAEFAPEDAAAVRALLAKLDVAAPLVEETIFRGPIDQPWQLAHPKLLRMGALFDLRKSYKELVDSWFRSPVLRAFFYGFPSYSGQGYDSKAAGALLIPYLMLSEGVFWPETADGQGGVSAIPRALERLARELGVEFRFGAKVTGLETDGDRVRAVRVGDERIGADAVLCNLDRQTAGRWLGRIPLTSPGPSYFTLHWGVRRSFLELRHHTLLIPRDFEQGFERLYRLRRPPVRPIVYLNETTGMTPSDAPEGCTNLFAVVTVPGCEPDLDWSAEAVRLAGAVRDEMRGFNFDWTPEEQEFERMQSPPTFAQRDGNHLGSLYGPHEAHRLWGMLPLRNCDERFRNLAYCGGSVQPGAGLPMVTLSGRFAAAKVCR